MKKTQMELLLFNLALVFIYAVFFSLSNMACGKKATTSSSSGSSAPTPPGVIDLSNGMYIRVNPPAGTNYYIHKDGDFNSACSISPTATAYADKDIQCTVEAEELEGVFNGVSMVLNVPPSMCTYVYYYPYFYFGEQVGTGATAVTVNFNKDNVFLGSTVLPAGEAIVKPDGSYYCKYDYSQRADPGPDCCLGSYTLTTNLNVGSSDPEALPNTTTEDKSWAGKAGNCATGSGADSAPRSEGSNMPVAKLYFKPEGFNDEFKTGEPIQVKRGSLYYANYYSGTAPAAFMQSSTYKGNPYYEWGCLDDSDEYKYRIRVKIREWNEMSQFALKSTGNPDTTGTETDWGTNINDFSDWLDIVLAGDGFPGMKF